MKHGRLFNMSQRLIRVVESIMDEKLTMDDYKKVVGNIVPFELQHEKAGQIHNYVTWAIDTLRKNNRILWFLRWASLKICSQEYGDTDTMQSLVVRFSGKAGIDPDEVLETVRTLRINSLMAELGHFFTPYIVESIPKIKNYSFQYQTPQEVLDDLKSFEDEHSAKNTEGVSIKELIGPSQLEVGAKKRIEFDNGWAWWDLSTNSSADEGRSCKNCGAAEVGGSTLLSLRRPVMIGKTQYLKSELTVELTNDGYILQLRHGNEKPSEEYHPYIMKLLLSDQWSIDGFKIPRFHPDDTFSVNDLSKENRNLLRDKNEDLLSTPEPSLQTVYSYSDEFLVENENLEQAESMDDAVATVSGFIEEMTSNIRISYTINVEERMTDWENDDEYGESRVVTEDIGEEQEEPDCNHPEGHVWKVDSGADAGKDVVVRIGRSGTEEYFRRSSKKAYVSCRDPVICKHCGTRMAVIGPFSRVLSTRNVYEVKTVEVYLQDVYNPEH